MLGSNEHLFENSEGKVNIHRRQKLIYTLVLKNVAVNLLRQILTDFDNLCMTLILIFHNYAKAQKISK